MRLALTKSTKDQNYVQWLKNYNSNLEVVILDPDKKNMDDLDGCSGLLLSGGEDVHPKFYGKPEFLKYCHASDINEKRDEFELALLEKSEKLALPILGICRGLQIYNVFKSGTLIPDIPSWGKPEHSKISKEKDRYHEIHIEQNSLLFELIKTFKIMVNSNHHQSADHIGPGLYASAFSQDGVIEAIERSERNASGYLLLVQWHPERIDADFANPDLSSRMILTSFIEASQIYSNTI